jgi:chitodextrinase
MGKMTAIKGFGKSSFSVFLLAFIAVMGLLGISGPGVVYAQDSQAPTTPSALTATAASATQINLSWTASTDNVGVTGYQVLRCQGTLCTPSTLVSTVSTTNFSDQGLSPSTSYRYRVRATDAAGNFSSYSSTVTRSTLADTQAPGAPTNLTASATSVTQINLSWTASSDNIGVTGYRVERCQGSGCSSFAQVATTTGTTYNNTGLSAGTTYNYRVRANDAAGNLSSYSNTSTATTLQDTAPPTAPSNLTASATSGSQINLSWTASTDNAGVTGYQVERCQGVGCSNFAQIGTSTGTTYSSTGLTELTSYSYQVRATDARSNLSGYSNTATATTRDVTAPSTPSNLTASAVSDSQINLSWTFSTDNVGVTGYRVERCQGSTCSNFTLVTTVTGPSYNNAGLLPSTAYRYRVRATDAAGNLSSYSNIPSATTLADATPPTAPSNLTASTPSNGQITLSWTASTDNGGVTGYRIERCQGAGCSNFTQVGTSTGTTYSNTGLPQLTTYSYRVRATDARSNLSAYSNVATATTRDATAPTAPSNLTASAGGSSQMNLSWIASTDNVGVTGYRVERCQGASCSNFSQVATGSGTTFYDTGLHASTTYNYRVRATDAVGNLSTYSNTSSGTTKKPVSLVLVNSESRYYTDFQQFIKPYLDNFGIPYNVLDIASDPVPANIGDAAVIIIGHAEFDTGDILYLSPTEQSYITAAVNAGTGLINFDPVLDDSGTPRYDYIQSIFRFGYNNAEGDNGITFPNPAGHYITQRHSAGETIDTQYMPIGRITLPSGVTALATTSTGQPFLAVTTYGSGRAVQWNSYDWMSIYIKGPLLGVDDLVWRSIVWAARKPFVMQGMPPFVTMRMDDVISPLWWVPIANEFGFIPWLGVFSDDINDAEAAGLSNMANSGKATVGLHAFGTDNFFYFDHTNGTNFSDSTMAAHYVSAANWFNTHNIPISKYLVPHFYEIGSNAFNGLQNWGVEFIGTMMDPGQPQDSPWMMKGPYRLYQEGYVTDSVNPYYADFITVPGHSEMNGKFFNCVTEIRDVTGYEWLGGGRNNVNAGIQDGTTWLKRSFDSMVLATLFSHEYAFMGSISETGWRTTLQGITNNIAPYNPIYVSMDYACQYVRAKYNSRITSNEYNVATQQNTTTFGGYTDLPTKFYLFTENSGTIQQSLIDVPQINGFAQVISTPPPPDTVPPTVTSVFPLSGASGVSTFVNLTATFSEGMNLSTINTNTFELRDSLNVLVPATVSYNAATKKATLTFTGLLATSSRYTAAIKGGANGVKDESGNAMSAGYSWSFTTDSQTELTIWDQTIPLSNVITDEQPIEVGVKFSSDIQGYISGVRFYKGSLNNGTHVAHLWNRSGILMASATFMNESDTGWQEATFSSPVPIMANTTYVASYYSPSGYFSADEGYFWGIGANKGPIHLLADGVDGPNGVFRYGTGFPTMSNNSSNFWVDIVFVTAGPPDTVPPTVYSNIPWNNSSGRRITTNVNATFSEPIDPATVTAGTFELLDPTNRLVAATVTYDSSTWTATLNPNVDLAYSTTYMVTLKGGSNGVKDLAGNSLANDLIWSFSTEPFLLPPNQGPGGPILIITSSSNPFSEYYAEILRTEGFNYFDLSDISQVSAAKLLNYDVAILGEMALTSSQVTLLTNWVYAGGNLIAMRPDKKLASLLGLTTSALTLSDSYLLVNTTSSPGKGIVNQTIQFHGPADLYGLSNATSVATLYSNANTATQNPAVTLRTLGGNGGNVATFTYDLAKSVVYTRQGNPAWAGQERDGIPPVRSNDLFFGAASGDMQPDWVDLNKVQIPQADEQQRLLANLIIKMNFKRKPLPRFWYFPQSVEAVIIMTGDDHGPGGTAGRFDGYIAKSPPNCSVDNWECIRGTSYIEKSALTEAQAIAYEAAGFELAVHIDTGCADWTQSTLETVYTEQLAEFYRNYPSLSTPLTNRTHCIVWSDYDTQPQIELLNGIRLDTNYYYWPSAWMSDKPGFFTGSGMPMRFTKANGSFIDVYQATTQMTDESGQAYPFTINQLLDRAIGAEGYYGAFTVNMHTDAALSSGSDAIIASAHQRGIPVVSARQMLHWLDGRNNSSFGSLSWNGNTLTFSISNGQNTNGLMAMVPMPAGSVVGSVLQNGNLIAHSMGAIKGIPYAFFYGTPGSYQVAFVADNTPPSITLTSPSNGASGVNTGTEVTVTFNEDIDPTTITASTFTLRDPANIAVPAQIFYDAPSKTVTLRPTSSLLTQTAYTALVKGGAGGVMDLAGNPMGNNVTWSFTTSPVQNYTIFNFGTVPVNEGISDGQPIEVGVKFRADVNGYITGLRFYKGSLNTGIHVGNLWDGSGILLSSATFVNETSSGWQEISFATPIPITANTTYVASYYSQSGYFALDLNYFVAAVHNGLLQALADGVDGGNGVFKYGSSGFPNQSGYSRNYWVDVVFSTILPPDTKPPSVTLSFPSSGASDVTTSANVTATFSEAMAPATITASTFVLRDSMNVVVPAQISYDSSTKTAILNPSSLLSVLTVYTITLKGGTNGVKDLSGNPMSSDVVWSFATARRDAYTIWNDGTVPQYEAVSDGEPIELGIKFRADVNGYITGLRFYKGALNNGTHIGNLWDSSGVLVSSAIFTNESVSGWQEVVFTTAVPITANTTYIASYYSESGYFAMDVGYFAVGVDNGALHALANGLDGPNGVFKYGSGFPTSGGGNNYWVDVVFQPAP